MRWLTIILLASIVSSAPAHALEFFSGDPVVIDSPVADDIFAGASTVKVLAPVDSAVIVGGDVLIDAPIRGDLLVAGGTVDINSDVGGKILAAGGTINLRGDVERNVVMAGGTVKVLPTSNIGMDAALTGTEVQNGGNVAGTLWVSAANFVNTGDVGDLKFRIVEEEGAEGPRTLISTFSLLMILGFLIVGLVSLRLFPGVFSAVDGEVRRSPAARALLGLGLMVAATILVIVSALSVVGIPLALLLLALAAAALLAANLFVSFSLGRWIVSALNRDLADLSAFVIGYLVLSLLFLIPYAGSLMELISIGLGFGAAATALNESRRRG
ncbi:hypothetical protein [Methanothrix harundinacea]|jgi:hypothetical protein|uniref:DUF8173 domain-containing protein n=1 Tax=Methanothrix harundinacea (strain 6Ac) TaxID=1110509 RepID=G7WN44_METH6|nr:hypothetical protein [Methanothrix harundinacea]AET63900.1 hypothetical protein Mhar_0518 [Methanothrix harundinacea 6Ac]